MQINLSSRKISRLVKNDSDMCKIVINKREFEIPNNLAICISDEIFQTYITDKSIRKYEFKVPTSDDQCYELFKDYLNTGRLNAKVDDRTFRDLVEIGKSLKINKLRKLSQSNMPEGINMNNIESKLDRSKSYQEQRNEIVFIAKHFHEFKNKDLASIGLKMGYDFVENLLLQPELTVEKEDQLMKFVLSLVKEDHANNRLFEYLNLEYISKDSMKELCEFFDDNIELVAEEAVWKALKRRLICDVTNIKRYPRKTPEVYKQVDSIAKLDIAISSSSVKEESELRKLFLDVPDKDIQTQDQPDQFFIVHFRSGYLTPESYMIQSRRFKPNKDYLLQSWKLEGKNDKGRWMVLDMHENDRLEFGETKMIPINTNERFAKFKITQIGPDQKGTNRFGLQVFDFQGRYYKNENN